jgi:hypothetical protein
MFNLTMYQHNNEKRVTFACNMDTLTMPKKTPKVLITKGISEAKIK